MTGTLAFIDCETVTLEPGPDVIWEVAVLTRGAAGQDHEWLFQLAPNMAKAQDKALDVGRFMQRFKVPPDIEAIAWSPVNRRTPSALTRDAAARTLATLLEGRHVVGACPWFDTERLGLLLRAHGLTPTWHHHLVDVEALTVGWLVGHGRPVELPYRSDELALALGVPPPAGRHTALGDARWARDIYDRIMVTR